MWISKIRHLFSILSLFILSTAVHAKWPEIPLPKDARLTVVSDQMILNGVEMKSWAINSWMPAEKTVEFYKKTWEKPTIENAPGFVESAFEGWHIISRLEGDYQITVQLDDSVLQTTKGLVSISKLPALKNPPAIGRGFPKVGEMQFINDIKAVDQNKKSRTIVARTTASVKKSVEHYRRVYKRKGWEEQTHQFAYEGQNKFGLLFNKRGKELNLTITRTSDKTDIVAVLVDY